jgi:predicted outer membrane repeat protein
MFAQQKVLRRAKVQWLCAGALVLWSANAEAGFKVMADAAAFINIGVDGKCDLAEAIASMNQGSPVNADCPVDSSLGNGEYVLLDATGSPTYELGANTSLTRTSEYLSITASPSGSQKVTIEAPGIVLYNRFAVSLVITNVTLQKKSGSSFGNVIYNEGILNLSNVVIQSGDVSYAGGGGVGGGIYNAYGATIESLEGCDIRNNKAWLGGGVFNDFGGDIQFVDGTTFENNTAIDTVAGGGGIYSGGSLDSFGNSTVKNNTSSGQGGGMYLNGDSFIFTTNIQGNSAANGRGGGVFVTGDGTKSTGIQQSVIQTNVAAQGGGVYAEGTQLTMDSCTLNGNKAVVAEATAVPPASGASISAPSTTACQASEDATHAFDDNLGTKWCTKGAGSPSTSSPVTLIYQFATPQVISAYSITSGNDAPERDPSDWLLQGSQDGTHWVQLHSVSGALFLAPSSATPGNGRFLTLDFGHGTSSGNPDFSNATAFKYYGLFITKNHGSTIGKPTNITQFAELGLFVNGKTGDGGGLYATAHSSLNNMTFSQNLAGCTSAACACSDAWCASSSGTSAAFGKGGGIFAGNSPEPETFAFFLTVAANTASQAGGVYRELFDDWNWRWSIIGANIARTTSAPEPDFHGDPHSLPREGGCLFGSSAGVKIASNDDGGQSGLKLQGQFGCNGFPNCDPDRVGDPKLVSLQYNGGYLSSMLTHMIQASSPALDIIPPGDATSTLDERGFPRVRGPGADYGATEHP